MTAKAVPDGHVVDPILGRLSRKYARIVQRIDEGSLDGDQVLGAFQAIFNKQFVKEGQEGTIVVPQKPVLVHDLWTPPNRQIELVKKWNAERYWGFTDEDFANLGNPPHFADNRLMAVVLEICLPGVGKEVTTIGGIQRTFDELWSLTTSRQHASWRWESVLSDPEHLYLHGDREHQPGLNWRVVDFGANQRQSTLNVCQQQDGPFPAEVVLSAGAIHDQWVRSMDGVNVPYVDMPGYELTVPGSDPRQRVPYLSFDSGNHEVKLNASRRGGAYDDWAVPVFVRE